MKCNTGNTKDARANDVLQKLVDQRGGAFGAEIVCASFGFDGLILATILEPLIGRNWGSFDEQEADDAVGW